MPHVLAEADGLVALYKPGGLHSAAIAGSAAPSVEALLPALLGESALADRAGRAGLACVPELTDLADLAASDASRSMPGADGATGFPRLLNRLDGPTSGILLAARTPQAADHFHAAENSGQATKTYLALVHGVLDGPATMRRALDTANRATTRVLPQDTSDPLRHTGVTPLGVMQATDMPNAAPCPSTLAGDAGQDSAPTPAYTPHAPGSASTPGAPCTPCTLVRCVIRKGARHQIRAHLAALGHSIVGDTRYGNPDGAGATTMPQGAPHSARPPAPATLFLHHARSEE
ncbi:pseudouridine synthase family protein, partial [Nitratidesulfovibrio liaohensis]|uniref:pseudouridine synthase family protein n=1 Tax=Nitratidesulfovibrio liaohensis TaxID=2604158 RepID=UPI001420C43F